MTCQIHTGTRHSATLIVTSSEKKKYRKKTFQRVEERAACSDTETVIPCDLSKVITPPVHIGVLRKVITPPVHIGVLRPVREELAFGVDQGFEDAYDLGNFLGRHIVGQLKHGPTGWAERDFLAAPG